MDKYIFKVTMTHTFYLRLVTILNMSKLKEISLNVIAKLREKMEGKKHYRKVGVTLSIHMNHFHPVYKT